jgi:Protein of unknown function (DUF551)
MTTKDEALALALEALQIADNISLVGSAYTPKSIGAGLDKIRAAITAIKHAQQAQEPDYPGACKTCGNTYLASRTDVHKDKRPFIYCDCCGAMADSKTWYLTHGTAPKQAVPAWQPIETAPKDEGSYLVASAVQGLVAPCVQGVIHNNPGTKWDWKYGEAITHWMPLPPAPEAT